MQRTTERTIWAIAVLWLLTSGTGYAQIHSSGDTANTEDVSPDATDANARWRGVGYSSIGAS